MSSSVFDHIRRNPKAALAAMEKDDIADVLRRAADAYYNSNAPLLSDEVFDLVQAHMKKLDPRHPVLRDVGAPVVGNREKVKLPYWMGSLDKIRDDPKALTSWKSKYKGGGYVVSDKLDGISALLVDGKRLYTRGDGSVGQDITHLLSYIRGMPNLTNLDGMCVRGELIISRKNWEQLRGVGANARNTVSGIVNAKTPDAKTASFVEFVAYELVRPSTLPASEGLRMAAAKGLRVVDHVAVKEDTLDMNYLSQHLLERRERSDFEVDGIVCMHDAVHPPKKGKNPSHGFAFKSILTHDEAEVTVTDVEWNASKDGYLKPLVRFNPVALGGVTISKATGFNAQYIVANGIAPGALIAVIRSGDVIPHIVRVVVRADPPALPKDVAYVWTDTHVDIKIVERDDAVEVKKMAHFCKTLDIKHVAQKTLQRLYEGGVDTIPKFVAVTVDDIVRLDGFQQTSAERIVQEIERAMKDATTERLMVASNMFGRGLGDKKVSAICAAHKGDLDAMTVESVTQVDGIGEATARTFIQALPAFRAFLRHVGRSATPRHENTRAERNSMNVVFTGFRDKDLEKRIIDMGGSLQSNVTKTTTLVVAKDPSEQSTKLDKARQLGIKIVSKEDMLSM